MRETALVSQANGRLRCEVCQWRCALGDGEVGRCLVRQRQGGAIIAINDSLVSAATIGPIEDYGFRHFFPDAMVFALGGWGTPFPAQQNHSHHATIPADETKRRSLSAERVVRFSMERLTRGIVWAYNDPVVGHEQLLESMMLARSSGRITGIVTGGFWSKAALDQLGPYLDGINLTVHGFSNDTYRVLTGIEEWRGIFASAKHAVKHWRCHLEITMPIATGINDSSAEVEAIAGWIKTTFDSLIPLRVIPANDADTNAATSVRRLFQSLGLPFVYGAATNETTRCPNCGWAVIERHDNQARLIGVADSRCENCNADVYIRTSLFKQRPANR